MDERRATEILAAERERLGRLLDVARARRADDADGGVFDELSSMDQHQADAASETLEAEIDATILDMARSRVEELELAFRRLAAGTYGVCESCGEPIADERLEAEPATRFCVGHELAWELHAAAVGMVAPTGVFEGLPEDDEAEESVTLSAEEAGMHEERAR